MAEPEPVAEPAVAEMPESAAEPEPEPEKPVAVTEPEPVAEPEAAVAPEPTVEPEPQAQPEPEAVKAPKAEPEVAPEPEPEPEPVAAAVEPSVAEEAPEAAEAPQPSPSSSPSPEPAVAAPAVAAPAADDESGTGGAGGKTEATEGEAEAGKPATTAAKVRTRAPGLSAPYKAAGAVLKERDLTGARAKVYLVLDRSASMRPYYKDGSAQALGEQTLALAAHLDPEATVPVVFFSTELDGTGELTLTEHENKVDELHNGLGRMGRTSYHVAVEEVLAQHQKSADPTAPALVVFQTDGAPDAKTPATQALTDAAKNHPSVHFAFVAFGDPENKAFDYLRKLKSANTSHFLAGETPRELTDTEVYEGLLATWRP
ncbi:VWA domain-containing protein [Streptomyces capitiformicae]|uniref:VWA domain-containing protein n=1 Tax=Streptomyces capitiformicae TaxID=2014920 RepID=UPI002FCCEA75